MERVTRGWGVDRISRLGPLVVEDVAPAPIGDARRLRQQLGAACSIDVVAQQDVALLRCCPIAAYRLILRILKAGKWNELCGNGGVNSARLTLGGFGVYGTMWSPAPTSGRPAVSGITTERLPLVPVANCGVVIGGRPLPASCR